MRWTAIDSERFNPGTPTSKAGSLAIASARRVQVNPAKFSFGSFTENLPVNRVRDATASGSVPFQMSQKCLLVKASELCQIRMSLTLVGKPFLGLRIFSKWLLDRRICRCAIPNRAALPVRFSRGEGVDPCRKSILRNTLVGRNQRRVLFPSDRLQPASFSSTQVVPFFLSGTSNASRSTVSFLSG